MEGLETISIYYNDNDNTFEDEYGDTEMDVSDLMSAEDIIRAKQVGGTYYFTTTYGLPKGTTVYPNTQYEIVFPINDSDRTLYYDVEENIMLNETGEVVFNIFSIVHPNDLYLFKKKRDTMKVRGVSGGSVELIWPDCIP